MINNKTPGEVQARGLLLVGYDLHRQARVKGKTLLRRFKAHYGCEPRVYAKLWEVLQTTDIVGARLPVNKNNNKAFDRFLMAIYYLKGYETEEKVASRFGVCEETMRMWVDKFVTRISKLLPKYVVWPDSWETEFIISVDCVNFGTNEPRHPTLHKQQKFFDRKGGKAGLTYEIALHLWKNKVVWFNGPFAPNDGGDRAIFMEKGLHDKIPNGKKVIADKIYTGILKIALHNSLDTKEVREFKARARARQESINARLKNFGCLKNRFRHGIARHKVFASAVMVVSCVAIENGSPLFDV